MTKLEEHDGMATQLDEMNHDKLLELYKTFDPKAESVGQASTLMGLKILILSKQNPDLYETVQGGGFSSVLRKRCFNFYRLKKHKTTNRTIDRLEGLWTVFGQWFIDIEIICIENQIIGCSSYVDPCDD